MVKKGREGEEGKTEVLDAKDEGDKGICALLTSFSQLGRSAWERLRSKSGLTGERPMAFTEREWERREGGRENMYRESWPG